jgi:cobalt-zinc-cadmium efflux system membrane fusion protein
MSRSLVLAALLLSASPAWADFLAVTPQQAGSLGIRTVAARAAVIQPAVSILGRVTAAPDSRLPVSAPFAGSVSSLIRLEGETVRKGEALAVIASSDMSAAAGRLQGLEAQYRTARAAADRARALEKEGIAPRSRVEEAESEEASAAADLAASRVGMQRASRAADGSYRLLAPAGGRIASISVGIGDQVAAMQPLMTIDTRQEFWIEGALPAGAVGLVQAGDEVRADSLPAISGTVMAAGATIDPRTRSAPLRARLNGSGGVVAGQTLRLTVYRRSPAGSLTVPRGALIEANGQTLLFVARRGGFESVTVRVVARGPQEATVAGGLNAGDQVAVTGLSELKAMGAGK